LISVNQNSTRQVPVMMSSTRLDGSPLPKQLSQPELGVAESNRTVVQSLGGQPPMMGRSLGSLGSSQGEGWLVYIYINLTSNFP